MMQSKKCPMRKHLQVNTYGSYGEVQTEKFLHCIGEECAWWTGSNCCLQFLNIKEVGK